jgi:hypothetical protein
LLASLRAIVEKTAALIPEASKLPLAVRDARLGLETGAIVNLAHKLIAILMVRDPLSERVHLSKLGMIWHGLQGALQASAGRLVAPAGSLRLRLK